MKLIRKKKQTDNAEESQNKAVKKEGSDVRLRTGFQDPQASVWKVLVVDDEPDVHAITKLSLKNFTFDGKGIQFLDAASGKEAEEILKLHQDMAAALVDVVMETEDAGLRLVSFIREELRNTAIRLIIRTGQPGAAPERYVIDHYDIDDYKDKTELVAQKLYTTIRSAIKSYRDISIIHRNRLGLEKILNAAPDLYRIQPMQRFFEGVLTQMIGCCHLGDHNLISTINGFLAISEEESGISIQAGTGRFAENSGKADLERIISEFKADKNSLPEGALLLPLKIHEQIKGFIYMEDARLTGEADRHLIHIMANQCAAALANLNLYHNLDAANKLNERKNQFLGMAAHDLRNPLAGVEMALTMLDMTASNRLKPDELEFIELAKSLNDTATRLVSDLLDIAKIESGKLELDLMDADVASIILESLERNQFLADSKHIEVLFEADDSIPKMKVDLIKLHQVMVNLISNAVKYSKPHTRVRISLSKKTENEVIIAVKDEGQGIPEDEIGNIFQPFAKTSVKSTGGETSTGLGLVICKKIVEAHGGRIWVESNVGVGSTFYVSLPIER